jgi:hypothetical protein
MIPGQPKCSCFGRTPSFFTPKRSKMVRYWSGKGAKFGPICSNRQGIGLSRTLQTEPKRLSHKPWTLNPKCGRSSRRWFLLQVHGQGLQGKTCQALNPRARTLTFRLFPLDPEASTLLNPISNLNPKPFKPRTLNPKLWTLIPSS